MLDNDYDVHEEIYTELENVLANSERTNIQNFECGNWIELNGLPENVEISGLHYCNRVPARMSIDIERTQQISNTPKKQNITLLLHPYTLILVMSGFNLNASIIDISFRMRIC